MILGDFGTSYSKILHLDGNSNIPAILPTKELDPGMRVDFATGHNGKRRTGTYINELITLARGGMALTGQDTFLLLDCGSRDIKFVEFREGRLHNMGWNAECGASMGFTIELLGKYYDIDFMKLPMPKNSFSVICGVLGMSHIFDAIISGVSPAQAVAGFVKGIALNAFRFCGSPRRLYLSGGLCENPVFVGSMPSEVTPLGRFVLLEGLKHIVNDR